MMDDPNQPLSDQLIDEITKTLRSLSEIEVRVPSSHLVLGDPNFWANCKLLTPNPLEDLRSRIFVDGFDGCCHWNSWKVYRDAIEPGLTLWAGFAFARGAWVHHEWCMLSGRIVETTWSFTSYYGAQIQPREIDLMTEKFSKVDFTKYVDPRVGVWTFSNERRQVVPYDPAIYATTIGRERDPKTSELKEGLGR